MPNVSFNSVAVSWAKYWTDFKAFVTSKSLPVQYDDDGMIYTIYAIDGLIVYQTVIWQGEVPESLVTAGYSQAQNDADKADFVANYLPTANKSAADAVGVVGTAVPTRALQIGATDGTSLLVPRVFDVDSGAGTQYALGANLRRSASGGSEELIGQTTMAKSLPVTMASDQGSISMSGSVGVNAYPSTPNSPFVMNSTSSVLFTFTGSHEFLFVTLTNNGSFVGSGLNVEISTDTGTTFTQVPVMNTAAELAATITSFAPPTAGTTKVYMVPLTQGATSARVTAAVYTSGFMNVTIGSSSAPPSIISAMAIAATATGGKTTLLSFDADTGAGTQNVIGSNLRISASGGSIEAKGQQTKASSIPVTMASDQEPIDGSLANGAQTTVDNTAGGVQIVAANANRKTLIIQNTGSNNIRVGISGVTNTTGVRLTAGASLIFAGHGIPTNAIFAIREGASNSTALVQEVA